MLTLLLMAAALPTAVDAENAFARDAQRLGQWTAFRKYADPDAVMFNPQAVWAFEFLNGRKDPPASVKWRPAASYVSCDGRIAVNTGPWERNAGKSVGYFTTVWQKEKRQWRWVYDGGDSLKTPMALGKRPTVKRASCRGRPTGAPLMAPPPAVKRRGKGPPDDFGRGQSSDRTLGWDWKVNRKGGREFRTFLWNGHGYDLALSQKIAGE
jgi:hypothetical protein